MVIGPVLWRPLARLIWARCAASDADAVELLPRQKRVGVGLNGWAGELHLRTNKPAAPYVFNGDIWHSNCCFLPWTNT